MWLRAVRWLLYGPLILLGVFCAGLAAVLALHSLPGGPTFGWPLRVTARTNVLIMGLDRTVSDQNPNIVYPVSRTDTLIAASFDPASRHVYLLSIPRDTRAPIPGHGIDKINAAHAYGGAALSLRATQNFLGVSFPYYIEITERGLVHLIDAVGGVTIRIDRDLDYDDNWDGLHIHLKKGNRRLGGKDAMGYARFRHDPLGDVGRTQRQQQLMSAILDELRRPRVLLRTDRILRVFREDITTNLEAKQLIALGWFGVRLPPGGMLRETLPGTFGQTAAGYWLPDPGKDRAIVAGWFYGVAPGTLADAAVEVLDAAAGRGAAADAVARLQALGVRVLRIGTAPDPADTTVIAHRKDSPLGGIIASALGIEHVVMQENASGPDVSVVVGKDYVPTPPMGSAP